MFPTLPRTVRNLRGDRVARRRTQLGRSQEWLAEQAGYERQGSIGQIEGGIGNPSARRLAALADALELSIDWLFGDGPDDRYERDGAETDDVTRTRELLRAHEAEVDRLEAEVRQLRSSLRAAEQQASYEAEEREA